MGELPEVDTIEAAIRVVRGQRVMLDADLARLYGVLTERLNEQVRRNQARFPADFCFRITPEEWQGMYPQIAGTLRRTRRADRLPVAFTGNAELARKFDELARVVERQGGQLTVHDATISRLLAEIRRLTRFPEASGRQIGFTAPWSEEK